MAEATLHKPTGVIEKVATGTVASGEIIQMSDGRAGVLQGLQGVVSGDPSAYATEGIFKVAAATGTTFAAGVAVYWDYSANLAIAGTSLAAEDFYLGRAVAAKASGPLFVLVDLNAVAPVSNWTAAAGTPYLFDCEDGVDAAVHTLIPAANNPSGLLILGVYAVVTEVFAGAAEDQGIVTIKDTEAVPNTLCTLTPTNGGADAIGDVVAGASAAPVLGSATGTAISTVAAGKGVTGAVTQATSGAGAAGKMRVYVLAIPLV